MILYMKEFMVVFIGMVLIGCSRNPTTPVPLKSEKQFNSPFVETTANSVVRPLIRSSRISFSGQTKGLSPVDSLSEVLDLYTEKELNPIMSFTCASCRIQKIEGLERLPNLKILDLLANRISAISNLEAVPKLEIINLSRNPIEKIEGLDGLHDLRELVLVGCRIRKIEGLEKAEKLKWLLLEGNGIEEITGVENLSSLERLGLAGNALKDLSGLRQLKNLREVTIHSKDNQFDEEDFEFIRQWNAEHEGNSSLQLRSGIPGAPL